MKKEESQNKNKEILMLNSYAATIPVWIDSEQKRSQKDWIRIKTVVGEALQDLARAYFSAKENNKKLSELSDADFMMNLPENNRLSEEDRSLIEKNEDLPILRDPRYFTMSYQISSFGVNSNNYASFRQSIANLYRCGVLIPIKGSDGAVKYYQGRSMFIGTIPADSYSKYVYISLDKEVADMAMNMQLGYTKIEKDAILKYSKSAHVQSMYYLLCMYKDMKEMPFKYSINKFKTFLGIDRDSYKEVSRLKDKVLDKVQKEIKTLYDKGLVNLYFTYKVDGSKQNILFTIYDRKKLEAAVALTKEGNEIKNILLKEFNISESVAINIAQKAEKYDFDADDIMNKVSEIKDYLSTKKEKINDIDKYILATFSNMFETDYADDNEDALKVAKEKFDALKEEPTDISRKFDYAFALMCIKLKAKDLNKVNNAKVILETYNAAAGEFLVDVSSKEVYNIIESNVVRLRDCIKNIFNIDKINLLYRIIK